MVGDQVSDVLRAPRSGEFTQQVDDRGEGRRPPSFEAQIEGSGADAGPEFGCQSGLADTRGADHGGQPAGRSVHGVLEHGAHGGELGDPSDERNVVLRGLQARVHDLERGESVGLPFDPDFAQHLVRDDRAGEPPGVLADHHATGLAGGLEPGRGVEDVTDEVFVGVVDHQLAGVDPDAHPELDAVLIANRVGEGAEAALHLQPGRHRA